MISGLAQASGKASARQFTQSKAAARNALTGLLSAISRTARAISITTPGIEQKFRFNYELKDQELLTRAFTFAADALSIRGEFIKRGMRPDFLNDLESIITSFEQAQAHVNATGTIDDLIERGMQIVRELNVIMRNLFADSPGKLVAWLSASHVERPAQRSRPVPVAKPAE